MNFYHDFNQTKTGRWIVKAFWLAILALNIAFIIDVFKTGNF